MGCGFYKTMKYNVDVLMTDTKLLNHVFIEKKGLEIRNFVFILYKMHSVLKTNIRFEFLIIFYPRNHLGTN